MAHTRRPPAEQVTCGYLRFEYNTPKGDKEFHVLPLIQVSLQSETEELFTSALLDSGATDTLVPMELAQILSLEFRKGPGGKPVAIETTGAGGVFGCYIARVKRIGCIKGKHAFASFFGREVLVPSTYGAIPYMILGRNIIFKAFDITFSEGRHKIVLTKP
ncbi:MAG: hypothetical protein JRN68_09695 [Nitrososphaerota archaeon]|nr:hypothetical protein [Nitrososphaerota archaeon]